MQRPARSRAVGANLSQAGSEASRAGSNLRAAGDRVAEAGQASVAAVREVAIATTDRVGERASEIAERAGETAAGIGSQVLGLPERVRETARRSLEAVESAGARAAVSVIQVGTKALGRAAEYVSELAPRRRVDHRALEALVVEQLAWAHAASEAYDRTVAETENGEMRMQLVRFKLATVKESEVLAELLRAIGGRVPSEERMTPPSPASVRERPGPAAAREGLAHTLTIAVQSAEGWRVLDRVATYAAPDRIAKAIQSAGTAVGDGPTEQVEFLRDALLAKSVEAVLR